MPSEPIIHLENVSKAYRLYDNPADQVKQALFFGLKNYGREFYALQDISLDIQKGETIGIIGKNGTGKSTLLQLVSGILTPTTGHVHVNGRIAALLELGAGFNPHFTGRENVYLNGLLYGLTHQQIKERFDAIAAFADIGDFIDQPVKNYSSGMLVRLAFSVIVHVDADILIIDEALAVGDVFFTQKCMRFLREFKKKGTLLFVSHDASAVRSLCDRAVLLENGRIKLIGDAKTVTNKYVESVYGKSDEVPANDPTQAQAESFGHGRARITSVTLRDTQTKKPLAVFSGGEHVSIEIETEALESIDEPVIIGFLIRDRLGQHLFGENTLRDNQHHDVTLKKGQKAVARFDFIMPELPKGDYTVTAAIASGSLLINTQEHWIHDALAFQLNPMHVTSGLIGWPMTSINLIHKN